MRNFLEVLCAVVVPVYLIQFLYYRHYCRKPVGASMPDNVELSVVPAEYELDYGYATEEALVI